MNILIRGTTPTLAFKLPFQADLLTEAWITLAQNKCEILTKELSDCTVQDDIISVKLTQAETMMLCANDMTQIQIRALTEDGNALASVVINVKTEAIIKGGEIA